MEFIAGHRVTPKAGPYKGEAGTVIKIERPQTEEVEGVPQQPGAAIGYVVSFERRPGMPGRPPVALRERFAPRELRLAKPAEIARSAELFPGEARKLTQTLRAARIDQSELTTEAARAIHDDLMGRIEAGEAFRAWQIAQAFKPAPAAESREGEA